MSRELGMTTAVLNFYKENIAKEAHYRLLARQREIEEGMTEEERLAKFNSAHQKRLARQREMSPKVEIPVLEKQIQKSDPIKLPALSRNGDNGQNKENVTVNLMKPVDASVRGQILNGISKEGLGKHAYLASRKMLAPQDKYNYQALSSWDYGWDVSDALKFHKPSPFARKMIVNQTFYRRNGVQNSPVEI
ncbi:Oidioi.mRNA.OKI2018_I69.chr1.g725.t1.cds [Oikopleura dioica]|uniref:Oidioi.mRNA.OKI2018_I69.chr1.g725.t1.cds n=1 Tax=Oikopleura dioica TaxID=34765 RepID=A0ABN7SUZ5_OIKDI|nr:Oidioi.mRNA.OKI2018_I69.chr1.g725.t1.cds [Oikopleura dioica]